MSAAMRRPSLVPPRRPSLTESGTGNVRSAMIVTSAHTHRDSHYGASHARHENTYQLQPDKRVASCKLQKIIRDTLSENLTNQHYSANSGPLTRSLADMIKQKAKELGIARYKYVCTVVMGPIKNSAVSMASRCVWNTNYDTFAEYTYRNNELYATAVIYGVYVE